MLKASLLPVLKRDADTSLLAAASGLADGLSDDEIWDILAFIKESWPDRERKLQEQRTEAEQTEGN